jgi:hypothetical protein
MQDNTLILDLVVPIETFIYLIYKQPQPLIASQVVVVVMQLDRISSHRCEMDLSTSFPRRWSSIT